MSTFAFYLNFLGFLNIALKIVSFVPQNTKLLQFVY